MGIRTGVLGVALCLLLLAGTALADAFPGYEKLRERAEKAWSRAGAGAGAYLVLVPPRSPLRAAAEKLARHRAAEIVEFSPASPEDSLETLIEERARYVAVFVEPSQMDVNLVRKLIVLSTLMDEDPFLDFAFGFFTGSSAEEVGRFVDRAIAADRDGVPPKTMQWCTSNISRKYAGYTFITGMPGDSQFVKLGDVEYAKKALADLEGAGFVHIGGCGDPEGIWLFDDERNLDATKHWPFDPAKVGQDPDGEMPRITADDFRKVRLENAVVWTHVCHIGSVGRMWVEGDIVSTFGRCERVEEYVVPPSRSVALAIIEAGASAYVAPLGPNFGAQSDIEQSLASETGAPLGDVMRRAYHDVVMDTGGHPEEIGLYVAGKPKRWDPDEFTNYNGPHNRALYGDPLLRPFGERRSPATVEIDAKERPGAIALTFRVKASGYLGRTWYGNRGRENAGRGRIYEVIPLDAAPTRVEVAKVAGRTAEGKAFPIVTKTALVERIDGKTFLHVQLVTDDAKALREAGAVVTALVRMEEEVEPPVIRLRSLGVPAATTDAPGRAINELFEYGDKLFVGTGDATANTGPTPIFALDPETGEFAREFDVDDEGIYRFRVLEGRLVVPGYDATEPWELGNVYVREAGTWTKHRTVPRGIHVTDVATWRGRWYAATGTWVEPTEGEQLAIGAVLSSGDRGATWRREIFTPADWRMVWRYGSLVVFRDRLYAFPFAYGEISPDSIPEELRQFCGRPYRGMDGKPAHTLYIPDPLGPADVAVNDGHGWRLVDLVPASSLCRLVPYVFGDRLLLSVVTGKWVAPFTYHVFEHRDLPPGVEGFLLAFDGEKTSRVPLRYDVMRDVLVEDGRVTALILRDGRYLLAESEDLESWTYHALAVGRGHPLSIERIGETWYVGMRDGNLMRSVGTAAADAVAQPERFEIVADLAREGVGPWAAIERIAEPTKKARLTCEIPSPDRVAVTTANVAAFRVFTGELGIEGSVSVEVDGAVAFRGPLEGASELILVKGEKGWTATRGDGTAATFEPVPQVVGEAAADFDRSGDDPTLGLWLADAMREKAGADVVLINRGIVRRDLAKGPISVSDVHGLFYRNHVATFRVKGVVLMKMLRVNLAAGGRDRCQFSGFTATWRKAGEALECSLDPKRDYLVAMPDWTAKNAEKLFGRKVDFEVGDWRVNEAVLEWLARRKTLEPIAPRLTVR